jgi:type II secretion system protein G
MVVRVWVYELIMKTISDLLCVLALLMAVCVSIDTSQAEQKTEDESKKINLDDPDIRNKILEFALFNLDDPDIRNEIRNKLLEGALTYDELEIRDKEGKVVSDKQGEYFYHAHNSKEPYTGWVKQSVRVKKIGDQRAYLHRYLQRVKDGKKHGVRGGWHENGQKTYEANFKDGKQHGLETYFCGSEFLAPYQGKKESNYKDGKRHGLETMWLSDGTKRSTTSYKDGKKHGQETVWNRDGTKRSTTSHKDGKRHGLHTRWGRDGTKSYEVSNVDGKLHHIDACAINMSNMHQACRASQNLNKYKTGEPIIWDDITGSADTFIEVTPQCPLGGRYILEAFYTEKGKPMVRCSNAETHSHLPKSADDLIMGGAIKVVVRDFAFIDNALQAYRNNDGCFPSDQQGLNVLVKKPSSSHLPPYWVQTMTQIPKDPWGNEYVYKYRGSKDFSRPEIISYGADGLEGSKDDISSQDPR